MSIIHGARMRVSILRNCNPDIRQEFGPKVMVIWEQGFNLPKLFQIGYNTIVKKSMDSSIITVLVVCRVNKLENYHDLVSSSHMPVKKNKN